MNPTNRHLLRKDTRSLKLHAQHCTLSQKQGAHHSKEALYNKLIHQNGIHHLRLLRNFHTSCGRWLLLHHMQQTRNHVVLSLWERRKNEWLRRRRKPLEVRANHIVRCLCVREMFVAQSKSTMLVLFYLYLTL